MNFILIMIISSVAFGKSLSMKDLSPGADISDIKQNVVKPVIAVAEIDLGPDPLNLPSKKKNYYPDKKYTPMLSPSELAKRQPAPESVGRHIPGY